MQGFLMFLGGKERVYEDQWVNSWLETILLYWTFALLYLVLQGSGMFLDGWYNP